MSYGPISLGSPMGADPMDSVRRAELASDAFKAGLRAERAKEEIAPEPIKPAAKPCGMGCHVDKYL